MMKNWGLQKIHEGALTDKVLILGSLRSYGDMILPIGRVKHGHTSTLNQLIHENKGWYLPVVPGTSFVSLGGAIANDIHGKNHHVDGSFCNHVEKILLKHRGQIVEIGGDNSLFHATCGGLGCTGEILDATIRLRPIKSYYIQSKIKTFKNLNEFLKLTNDCKEEFQVGWFNVLDKQLSGVYFSGTWANESLDWIEHDQKTFYYNGTTSLINPISVYMFNKLYEFKHQYVKDLKQSHWSFFFPLDSWKNWNSVYGNKGFCQFQAAFSEEWFEMAFKSIQEILKKYKKGSFLSVVKKMGPKKTAAILTFAKQGISLAIDIPGNYDENKKLWRELYQIVYDYAGWLYSAKDPMMDKRMFEFSYGKESIEQWVPHIDENYIGSRFLKRVLG